MDSLPNRVFVVYQNRFAKTFLKTQLSRKINILYTTFDQVPAPKGASTHILAFAKRLGQTFGNVALVTPAANDGPPRTILPGVTQLPLGVPGDNPVERTRVFREKLKRVLRRQLFQVVHFRSPLEGMAVIDPAIHRGAKLIYEVNGFPSIEMPYHYPALGVPLINKLRNMEQACIDAVDQIVTVSQVNQDAIVTRLNGPHSKALEKISIIRNGVDPSVFEFKSPDLSKRNDDLRLVYVGTVSPWQGIHVLLEAVELINKDMPCQLTIVGKQNRRRNRDLISQIERLGLKEKIQFVTAETPQEVCWQLHAADISVAPLMKTARNCVQGCCPLKIIEAMASGCPLIASGLPVVDELADPSRHYWRCKPQDPRNLKNVVLELLSQPAEASARAIAAREHVEATLTWDLATDKLVKIYNRLLASAF